MHWPLLAILLALPSVLVSQHAPNVKLTVRSCPSADSLLGPLPPGKTPQLKGIGPIDGQVFLHLANGRDPHASVTVVATGVPPATPPAPALDLLLVAEAATTAVRLPLPTEIALFIDDNQPIALSADSTQWIPGGLAALLNLRAHLSPQLVATIAAANRARIELGPNVVPLSDALRGAMRDAYRVALCGYAAP